jgi:hypothetical protein
VREGRFNAPSPFEPRRSRNYTLRIPEIEIFCLKKKAAHIYDSGNKKLLSGNQINSISVHIEGAGEGLVMKANAKPVTE